VTDVAQGRGFDMDSVEPDRFGLKSMRERADDSGGQLTVRSAPGEGRVVTVEWRTGASSDRQK
jgi:signal transduction histidine kinase